MNAPLDQASQNELQNLEQVLCKQLDTFKASGLKLDLTRGKPSADQLALSEGLENALSGDFSEGNIDLRNYGGLDGTPEAKALFAEVMGVDTSEILVGGNSSLTLMYFSMLFAMTQGNKAWNKSGQPVKILCPVPGYDRHFSVCDHLGIEMLTVDIREDGPDMDQVEAMVNADPQIKGIWCVPRFSNPTGAVYSSAVIERLAKLATIAGDNFRVFCDNAYAVHYIEEDAPELPDVMAAFKAAGTEDSLYLYGSTSKITFAGAGVGYVAMSPANLKEFKRNLGMTQIGPDKLNQERHVRFIKNKAGMDSLMAKHASLLKPRFDIVLKHLREELGPLGIAEWIEPKGGYFVSLDTRPGLAKEVVRLAAENGVKLTPAGATFPYGNDPQDRNIRIAPSYPTLEEIDQAMAVVTACVKLATVKQLLAG